MANKKFLDEEMLDDEQLDNVAGGSSHETSSDSFFLNRLNGSCNIYSADKLLGGAHDAEIAAAWESVGIHAVINSGNIDSDGVRSWVNYGAANEYFIMTDDKNNPLKKVSQMEAMNYATNYAKSH